LCNWICSPGNVLAILPANQHQPARARWISNEEIVL
jgi:hypothetical protein